MGEDDTWEAWLNFDASCFSSFVNFAGNGIKLRRGYSPSNSSKPSQDELRWQKEEDMDDCCSQVPVRHLVFMIHGIGQRLEISNLVDDVGNFWHIAASLAEQHLTPHHLGTQRVLFIPCQWRKGLKLSGENAVEKITLDGERGLRVTLSATVHDVLYYMSPIYCQDIINLVSNQLNLLYLKFLKRNPGYDGKVSLSGHSLGNFLSYDILCHQDNLSPPISMDWMYKEHGENEESLPDKKDHVQNSPINQDDTFSMVSPSEERKSTQETCSEMEAGYSEGSSVLGPALSSVNKFTAEPNSLEPSNKGDVFEFLSDSGDTFFENMGGALDKPESMGVDMPVDKEECKFTSNEDEVIKKLREEIDSLKANVAEKESRHSNNHTEEEFTFCTKVI